MIVHVRFIRTNTLTDMHKTCSNKKICNNTFVDMHFLLQIRPFILQYDTAKIFTFKQKATL